MTTELHENNLPADTGFIEHRWTRDGKTYIYRFDLITLKRGNLATEVMFFKRQQLQKPSKSINDMLLSGGGEYLNRCLAYLLTELDERGQAVKFDERLTYDRTLAFINDMSMKEAEKAEECINDFFGRRNLSQLASEISSRVNQLDALKMIVESGLMNQMPGIKSGIESMLSGIGSTGDSTGLTSSTDGSETQHTED